MFGCPDISFWICYLSRNSYWHQHKPTFRWTLDKLCPIITLVELLVELPLLKNPFRNWRLSSHFEIYLKTNGSELLYLCCRCYWCWCRNRAVPPAPVSWSYGSSEFSVSTSTNDTGAAFYWDHQLILNIIDIGRELFIYVYWNFIWFLHFLCFLLRVCICHALSEMTK